VSDLKYYEIQKKYNKIEMMAVRDLWKGELCEHRKSRLFKRYQDARKRNDKYIQICSKIKLGINKSGITK